jgi:hypothetical protein
MCKNQRDIHFTARLWISGGNLKTVFHKALSEKLSTHPSPKTAAMILQRRASSTRAAANPSERPGTSHYSHESHSANGTLEEHVAMPPIAETLEQPDFLALLLDASIDSDSPLQKLHPLENLHTRDIQALGRLEHVGASSHDAYLCDARLRNFGARRQRVPKMQSSYFLALSTQDDT